MRRCWQGEKNYGDATFQLGRRYDKAGGNGKSYMLPATARAPSLRDGLKQLPQAHTKTPSASRRYFVRESPARWARQSAMAC